MLDIHCHILHGIDDGARDLHESVEMLKAAKKAGIDSIVATPHVRESLDVISMAETRMTELRPYAAQLGIETHLGYEVHWNLIETLSSAALRRYCTQGTMYLLIEFSIHAKEAPSNMIRIMRSLQAEGMYLIIAHPERYVFVQRDIGTALMWKEMDCSLQLDVRELFNGFLDKSQNCANKLLNAGAYDYYASDAHCAQDYAAFVRARKRLS